MIIVAAETANEVVSGAFYSVMLVSAKIASKELSFWRASYCEAVKDFYSFGNREFQLAWVIQIEDIS